MRDARIWGTRGITIVIPPTGIQGRQLYEVAKSWTSIGLLGNSIWLDELDSQDSKKSPPHIVARVIGSTKAGEVSEFTEELFSLLAQYELRKLRVIVVRQAGANLAFDEVQDTFVEHLDDFLKAATPPHRTSDKITNDDFGLMSFNLITGQTQYEDLESSRYLDPIFNAHFVASAEDRTGPMNGDAFIREDVDSESFAGFTLLHVATLGALWTGIPKGSFEFASAERVHQGEVFVSRVFTSAILTDGLVLRACARVLEKAADPNLGMSALGMGLTISGTSPIPESQTDEWVDFMVDSTFAFENSFLAYRLSDQQSAPTKSRIGFWRQILDFLRFSGDRLVSIPVYIARWFLRKVTEIFNNLFQAGGSGSAVVGRNQKRVDPRDKIIMDKYQDVFRKKEEADRALISPVNRKLVDSTPELWEKTRKLIFGMLDGSNQHLFGIEKGENGLPVFYDLKTVFNDPNETYQVNTNPDSEQATSLTWDSYDEWLGARLSATQSVEDKTVELNNLLDSIVQSESKKQEIEDSIDSMRSVLNVDQGVIS